MSVFNTITINNTSVLAPNNFAPAREPVYGGEFTTYTGKLIADRIGWKYADLTLEWDYLPQAQLVAIAGISDEFEISFTDIDDTTVTETVIPRGFTSTGTRYTDDSGDAVWKGVQFQISFITTHTD